MTFSGYPPEKRYNIKVGTVLRLHVKNTIPPKYKRFIIVGFTQDKLSLATVYINSDINININWSQEQQALQLLFTSEGRPYLDRNSYIDCSKLMFRDTEEIYSAVHNNPDAIIGKLSEEDLKYVMNTLKYASTIKGKYKKRYGLYDSWT